MEGMRGNFFTTLLRPFFYILTDTDYSLYDIDMEMHSLLVAD